VAIPFPYPTDVETAMKVLYRSLRENDRRRYAAVEADRLGHGGLEYIAGLLECDPKTIRHGHLDLQHLHQQALEDLGPTPRVRKKAVDANRP
jgi:hypothetical protein